MGADYAHHIITCPPPIRISRSSNGPRLRRRCKCVCVKPTRIGDTCCLRNELKIVKQKLQSWYPISCPPLLPLAPAYYSPCGELRLGARTQSVGYGHPKCFQRMFNYLLFWHYCAAHCLNEMPFPWRDSHKWVWNIINKNSNLSKVFFLCQMMTQKTYWRCFRMCFCWLIISWVRLNSLVTKEWLRILRSLWEYFCHFFSCWTQSHNPLPLMTYKPHWGP